MQDSNIVASLHTTTRHTEELRPVACWHKVNRTINDIRSTAHLIEREFTILISLTRKFRKSLLIRIYIQFLVCNKFLKPFSRLLSMPGKRMTINC